MLSANFFSRIIWKPLFFIFVEISVKVLNVDTKKRRIGLSRKATMEAPKQEEKSRDKTPAVEEKARDMVVKPVQGKLKGGRGQSSGGEQFGLKW